MSADILIQGSNIIASSESTLIEVIPASTIVQVSSSISTTTTAHALGGALHTAATLAELNALISDADVDDDGDPRTPTAHASSHSDGGTDELNAVDLGSGAAAGGTVLTADGAGGNTYGSVATTDEKAGVTASDTTPGYLDDKILPGAGLTRTVIGGGSDEDFRLDVIANADGSIVVNADDLQVGVLASDAQHGNRGGGGIHAVAIASGAAGFLSGADKQLIDDLGTTYAGILHSSQHENGNPDEISVAGLSGLLADDQNPVDHASDHAGAGGDPITSLGAVTFTGVVDFTSATVINGLTDGNLLLTDTAGTDFGLIQLGGTTSSFPALKRSADLLQVRFADDSDFAPFASEHIGISIAPTATHMLFGAKLFDGGTGTRQAVGFFPTYKPATAVTNNLYAVQGNIFFGTSNWGANSNVNALQFFPAPDYSYGSASFGSSLVNLIGITTGGIINVLTKTVVANEIVGIATTSLSHIFGGPGNITANSAVGLRVGTPSTTTGTIGAQSGIEVLPQVGATRNMGIWIAGDNSTVVPPLGGCDIVFGAGKDAAIYYDGSNLIIDPNVAGTGRVVLGTIGQDSMLLDNIEIDGDLNHDGAGVGFYGTAPIAQQTGVAVTAAAVHAALVNLGLITA